MTDRPVRTLLVDDVPETRRLLRTALRFRGGFEVVGEADTGLAAVSLAEELDPDVVVLDLGLPDLGGRDVLTRLREVRPDAKVVVFSGADPDDRSWYESHTQGYVLKDADLDYLVDMLAAVADPATGAKATLDLPQNLESVSEARLFLRRHLAEWGLSGLSEEASLVVSELAANAVTHASSEYQVRLALTPMALRIEVVDKGPGTPEPRLPDMSDEHGRGLMMVAALSSSWGIARTEEQHKLVWAELTRPTMR